MRNGYKIRVFSFVIFSFLIIDAYGTDYYVKNAGNDSGTGTSDATAWASLAKVSSVIFQPGDHIYFKRGDLFRGQLYNNSSGSAGNPVVYDAYGTGAKPKIWGSRDYSSDNLWTNYSGNIWVTSSPVETGMDNIANLIFNNEQSCGKQETSISACDSQGDFYYNTDDNKVYIYSVGSPAVFYSHIEMGGVFEEYVVFCYGNSYVTFRNMDVRYSANNAMFTGYGSSNIIFEYNDVSWAGGTYYMIKYPVRMGNGIGVWKDASNIIIRYNRIDQCYDAGISPQGLKAYTMDNIQMYYNIITNCWYSYETWANKDQVHNNVNFYNNVCIDAGNQWSKNQRPDLNNARHVMIWDLKGTVTNCNIKNNIFKNSANTAIRIGNNITKINFDYNIYNVNVIYSTRGGTFTTLDQWQAATGLDSHSLSGDPLINANFSLSEGSPAINSGIDVGLIKDFFGNSIIGIPDIGSIEYGGQPPAGFPNNCTGNQME